MAVAATSSQHRLLALRSPTLSLRTLSNFYLGLKNQNFASRSLFSTSPVVERNHSEEPPVIDTFSVYSTSSTTSTVWPDSLLGVFAPNDPRFLLPGHVGLGEAQVHRVVPTSSTTFKHLDVLTSSTRREHQAQVLYTASDYIHYTPGAASYVTSGILLEVPEMSGAKNFEFSLHEAPRLLKRDLQSLFPDRDVMSETISVITLAQRTSCDMSTWSNEVEEERDLLSSQFVAVAKEICGRLRNDNYWSDFIDPTCGKPFFGVNTNTTFFETNEKFRLLGFRIEDLGCCKVISHKDFGRHVFVGTIVTSASVSCGVIQDLVVEMKLAAAPDQTSVEELRPLQH